MAAGSAALIVQQDGTIAATPELQESLHLPPGTRLELVQQNGAEVRFRIPVSVKEITHWRDLEGVLADSPDDPNAQLEAERIAELTRDTN